MSVLVVIEPSSGLINKGGFELATFGKETAAAVGGKSIALVLGTAGNAGELGVYGVDEVFTLDIATFDSKVYAQVVADAAKSLGAKFIIIKHNANGKAAAGRVAIKLNAGIVSAVNAVPIMDGNSLHVKRGVYSGKATATYSIVSDYKVITVLGNSIKPQEVGGILPVKELNISKPTSSLELVDRTTISGRAPLPEAELVVSGGRGFKGPENWNILLDLADALGATTACSRPVADADWRPHHEHVGQTGVAIRPNLYIAIGISGAIQHLAGVNSSKTIVVINKDPEAPFFKAADYGIVGDLFDVVPKLTAAIKMLKNQ